MATSQTLPFWWDDVSDFYTLEHLVFRPLNRVFSRIAVISFKKVNNRQTLEGCLNLRADVTPVPEKTVLSVGTMIELRSSFAAMRGDGLFKEICSLMSDSYLDTRSQMNYALFLYSMGKLDFWQNSVVLAEAGGEAIDAAAAPVAAEAVGVEDEHALRRRLHEGTLTTKVGATNRDVSDYWHGLQEDYRANADVKERISYGTSSYGLQDNNNFWFLGPELHIHESRKLEEAEYRYFETEDSLHKYATIIDEHLLNFDYLIQATGRFIGHSLTPDEMVSLHDVYEELDPNQRKMQASYVLQFLWQNLSNEFDVIGPYFKSEAGMKHQFVMTCILNAIHALHLYGFVGHGNCFGWCKYQLSCHKVLHNGVVHIYGMNPKEGNHTQDQGKEPKEQKNAGSVKTFGNKKPKLLRKKKHFNQRGDRVVNIPSSEAGTSTEAGNANTAEVMAMEQEEPSCSGATTDENGEFVCDVKSSKDATTQTKEFQYMFYKHIYKAPDREYFNSDDKVRFYTGLSS
ncbi:hypothetical protein ACROYT_G014492 [Oculina patagonica]